MPRRDRVDGRLTLGDVAGKRDSEVDVLAEVFPMLAIMPTAVLPGPFDPGGIGTRLNAAGWAILGAAGLALVGLRRRGHPDGSLT